MRLLKYIVTSAVVASFIVPLQSVSAASGFIAGSSVFKATRSAPAVSLLGYYVTNDTVRFFSDSARQTIEKNGGLTDYSDWVIANPQNNNIVYFVTSERINDVLHRVRMNSYNFKTRRLTVLFTQDLQANSENGFHTSYGIMGRIGNKIILDTESDNSPGPCANVWTSGGPYYSFDITKPSTGFKSYSVPKYLVQQGEKESKACEKSVNAAQGSGAIQ